MKYDPMMDDSSDDGLPDLEELPALEKASNADFEVDFHSKHLKSIFKFIVLFRLKIVSQKQKAQRHLNLFDLVLEKESLNQRN